MTKFLQAVEEWCFGSETDTARSIMQKYNNMLTEPICLNLAVASASVRLPRPSDAVGVDPSPTEVGSSLGSVTRVSGRITERKQQRCFLPISCAPSQKITKSY